MVVYNSDHILAWFGRPGARNRLGANCRVISGTETLVYRDALTCL